MPNQEEQTRSQLLSRDVLHGEINQDPQQAPPGVKQLLEAFCTAARNGMDSVAATIVVGLVTDPTVLTHVLLAAARDCGIEVDE